MTSDDNNAAQKDAVTGRFLAGNSGNGGRRKGARNKLGEEFLATLYDDFQEHGKAAIIKVREEKPEAYLKVIAAVLPKQLDLRSGSPLDDLSDAEVTDMLSILRSLQRSNPEAKQSH